MTGSYDVVFLSYDEPLADELYRLLTATFGTVRRVHGVHGMRQAYLRTSAVASTDAYFIADGDFEIAPSFRPQDVQPLPDGVAMRVWQTENAVNGLRYGYGGLKLCRRVAIAAMQPRVDVLAGLPGRVEFVPQVAGRTRFNQSPRHAWRAGFRECAMLARGCEYGMTAASAKRRIDRWLAGGSAPYAAWSVRGARDGLAFAGATAPDDTDRWENLNRPAWLDRHFWQNFGRGELS
ncbi:hypothetical protein [Micromonospora sp. KC723]|uniref:hypothetical protein n=1 Tax=Micromonospora sp. KC723 TaxID=2530381 RepID=UPI0010430C62|nr:hypothetical protein [Micromonospora sp. KC723]TDB78262.1 hypothetical protein E1165_00875 [Micromonospora sp. KC723]